MSYSELVKRVQNQDEIIAQLIKIIAATNHRLTEFIKEQQSDYKQEFIN